jgi:hypothetical protein
LLPLRQRVRFSRCCRAVDAARRRRRTLPTLLNSDAHAMFVCAAVFRAAA